jgi:hypothetical protein
MFYYLIFTIMINQIKMVMKIWKRPYEGGKGSEILENRVMITKWFNNIVAFL